MPQSLPTRAERSRKRIEELGIELDGHHYSKNTETGGQAHLWPGSWTPEEIHAIADDMASRIPLLSRKV